MGADDNGSKASSLFEGWDNFFVMIGSAAGGLIGLLFIVVTLTAGTDRARVARGQQLYMTPIALSFACVLTISGIAIAPRVPTIAAAALIGATALVGFVNNWVALLGIRNPPASGEPPHWSDLWMYGVAPTVLYLALIASSLTVAFAVPGATDAVAVLVMALLLVGIRNAWDLATWIAPRRPGLPG